MSRKVVREAVQSWVASAQINTLNQVFTSFPKRINFQVNSMPGQLSRAAAVVFIESEFESRIAIGGAHSGWKRIDYGIALQVFHHSSERTAELAMENFDELIDTIKDYLRADHNFGDTTGTIVWQGAEPSISTTYGTPTTTDGGTTETWCQIRFEVTEMIQA
jgi:hypothetical protein